MLTRSRPRYGRIAHDQGQRMLVEAEAASQAVGEHLWRGGFGRNLSVPTGQGLDSDSLEAHPTGCQVGRYILTGVAGSIASLVAELLLASGHTVAGVDNLNDASASDLGPGTAVAGYDAAKTTRATLKM